MLIDKQYRSLGLGKRIIHYLHNIYPNVRIELLATSSSRLFYEGIGFRTFYGYRKTKEE
ncbi:GNAT family N-acetyltransferase [Oceanobacillus sojae]|uniref:GNAT family N-acetyltransferase n=1 Tax=Oceanobacillus sojae TaxID=582851 RepID=UPI001FE7C3F3|nr:GNAT family N-acetyltransferase [Oceanobacillus sojae]